MESRASASRLTRPVQRLLTLAILAAVAGSIGCALSRPLHLREWYAVETRRFSISSSLSREETRQLALDLERFRSAVEYLQGPGASPPTTRTQVYAFDGRGFVRPFDVRGARGVFLPSMRGGILVLRTGKGWRGDATPELRHELAHFLFRNREGIERPLWFDEGFGQLASTLDVNPGGSVLMGRVRKDHLRVLRDNLWLPGDRIVQLESLEKLDAGNRRVFRAQSWGLVHLLLLGTQHPSKAGQAAQRYFERVAEEGPTDRALETAFGANGVELTRRLLEAVRTNTFGTVEIRADVAEEQAPPELRRLSVEEVLIRLGWLSIQFGRPDQAEEYFEMAVAENPRSALAHAGLGATDKLRADWEAAREHYAVALAEGSGDPIVQLEVGGYYHARAARTEDAALRQRLVELARDHYRRSIALDASLAEPHAVLGATSLRPGQHAADGLDALARAAELLPSSLEIELLRANAIARTGQSAAARRRAWNVFSRTHSQDLASAARQLAEAIQP